jgi:hypothetical protein
MSVQEAISRFRRDSALGALLKGVLGVGVLLVLLLHFLPLRASINPSLLLMALAGIWLVLWYRTVKSSRLAAESSSLIASGMLEQAEARIELSLRFFSMSRSVKSLGLLNLALLRLAQKRWPDTALLCRELLARGRGTSEHVSKSGRLMLADSLMEMGDLRAAHEALTGLYRHRLTLSESLHLLRVQSDYLLAIGAWGELLRDLPNKVALAETMPPHHGARLQAIFGLAAKRAGREQWANWLRRRVELLVDVQELVTARPLLGPLWET